VPSSLPQRVGQPEPSAWPGERLGLPRSGPRSVARVGRRLAALAIDWALAAVISATLFNYDRVATLLIFMLMQVVFIPTLGGSLGHRIVGLRLVPMAGGWVGVWRPVVRTVLLAIVIPALVWDSDQRGFHDKVAGTVLLRS